MTKYTTAFVLLCFCIGIEASRTIYSYTDGIHYFYYDIPDGWADIDENSAHSQYYIKMKDMPFHYPGKILVCLSKVWSCNVHTAPKRDSIDVRQLHLNGREIIKEAEKPDACPGLAPRILLLLITILILFQFFFNVIYIFWTNRRVH